MIKGEVGYDKATKYYRQKSNELVVSVRMSELRLVCQYCEAKGHTQQYTVSSFYQKHKNCGKEWCYASDGNIKLKKHGSGRYCKETDSDEDIPGGRKTVNLRKRKSC